ncbi:hypothetical protein CcCBS67573_g00571 [Chytriomyces confervae]|uniref:Nitroreductase domain-containing protein n=1 Tax=Chytriomyces confervae TaxID=246404 RepID=A0A507FP02_9FUNG|nr:hypothetical protein HDU80_001423 [Chytriomyces hyalinus]TPX78149.1 hypothetical protein CcCBS67573_g00571 [Chytriomyces confervae]
MGPLQPALSELLLSHRSIRKYTDREVPQDLLERAIEEAVAGGSTYGNLNAFSFVVTRDAEQKKKLRGFHNQSMLTDCSVVVTICADWFRTREWLKSHSAKDNFDNFLGYHVAVVDAVIMAQNLVLGLESRGLGVCYLGTTLEVMKQISDLLELPETCLPVTTLVIGYPAENPPKRDRLPTKAYIHNEVYHKPDPQEIAEMYASREVSGWNRYMGQPELRAKIEKNGIKGLAEYYTSDFKYPEQDFLKFGKDIWKLLREKSFNAGASD